MQQPGPATDNIAARWGEFVAGSHWTDIPAAVGHEGKRSILNMLGCSFGAASHPDLDTAIKILASLSGPAQAAVFGRAERLDILNAAFVNAVSANLLDFDDTHLDTVIHLPRSLCTRLAHHRDLRRVRSCRRARQAHRA
jgi:2-methylcitrate dehydratase PrpD